MAISVTHLTTDISDANATSYSTASISPTANRLISIAVIIEDTNPAGVPSVTGNGIVYTHVNNVEYDVSGTRRTIFWFRGMSATPIAGAVTIIPGEAISGCGWSIVELDGVNTSGTNGSGAVQQTASIGGSGTALSVSLAAFASSDNLCLAVAGSDDDCVFTAGSGFTIHGQDISPSASPVCGIMTESAPNDNSPDATMTPTAQWGMVGIEVIAAAGAPAVAKNRTLLGVGA